MICGVVLVLLAMPFALNMLNYQTTFVEDFIAKPIRNYGLSADPVNTIADCKITNMDDTDNLYGGAYKQYIMTLNVSDADTSATIANVTATFTGAAASFLWLNTTTYDGTTGCVTQPTGNSILTLVSSTNTTTTSGNTLNITITFEVEWGMADLDNVNLVVLTYDDTGGTDTDTKSAYCDFDTDLTLASDIFFTYAEVQQRAHIPLNTLTYSYEDSGGDNYPLAAETDFWVSKAASPGYAIGYYEAASYVDSTGVATWSSMVSTGTDLTDTFTLYAVSQSGGSSGTSLMDSIHTDTIDVVAGSPGKQTPRTRDGDDPFTYVQAGALLIIAVVFGGGAYCYSKRGSSTPRKRTTRKKKKTTRRKKK